MTNNNHKNNPLIVDLNPWCDSQQSMDGTSLPTVFNQLNDYVHHTLDDVIWQVKGISTTRPTIPCYDEILINTPTLKQPLTTVKVYRFLNVKADTQIKMTCGRCLQLFMLSLNVDTCLQVFQTDTSADEAALADNADELPDPIVAHHRFNLIEQIQEELLLAIPDNPTHLVDDPVCQLPNNPQAAHSSALSQALSQAGMRSSNH